MFRLRKNSLILLTILIFAFPAYESFAGKGMSTLFNLGRGVSHAGKKIYDQNFLTQSQLQLQLQLQNCVLTQGSIGEDDSLLKKELSSVNAKVQEIEKLTGKIDELKHFLDLNQNKTFETRADVDAYNNSIDKYNALLKNYNDVLEKYKVVEVAYNDDVNALNVKIEKLKGSCAGKSYYEEDLVAVNQQLQEQKGAGVTK